MTWHLEKFSFKIHLTLCTDLLLNTKMLQKQSSNIQFHHPFVL